MSIHIKGVVELGYSANYYEGFARIELGRADAYYPALANKKANTDPLRGFPENASLMTRLERAFYVLDTDQPAPYGLFVRLPDAIAAVNNGTAQWLNPERDRIYFVDQSSWVNYGELDAAIGHLKDYYAVQYLRAVLATMNALDPNHTRFVYWFT